MEWNAFEIVLFDSLIVCYIINCPGNQIKFILPLTNLLSYNPGRPAVIIDV